ncbi:MAG: hypothetical protein CMG80_05540 [Marinobacter sp.]|nr:hypothetical protein [Marinobacter sp.]
MITHAYLHIRKRGIPPLHCSLSSFSFAFSIGHLSHFLVIRQCCIVNLISDVDYLRYSESIEYFVAKISVIRMAEWLVCISDDTYTTTVSVLLDKVKFFLA